MSKTQQSQPCSTPLLRLANRNRTARSGRMKMLYISPLSHSLLALSLSLSRSGKQQQQQNDGGDGSNNNTRLCSSSPFPARPFVHVCHGASPSGFSIVHASHTHTHTRTVHHPIISHTDTHTRTPSRWNALSLDTRTVDSIDIEYLLTVNTRD